MRAHTLSLILVALPAAAFAGAADNPCSNGIAIDKPGCKGPNCNASIVSQSVTIGNNVHITQTGHVGGPQITVCGPDPVLPAPARP